MLEKLLKIKGFHKDTLKIKSPLKSTRKPLKNIEKYLNLAIFCMTYHENGNQYQYKIVVPLFGTAYTLH